MKWIFVVLGVFGATWAAPAMDDPLLVVVGQDAQQSVSLINANQQQRFVPIEIPENNNFRYLTRDFGGASYQFGYNTANAVDQDGEPQASMFRHEMRREDGTVVGRYGYVDPAGVERVYNYVVDQNGFRLLEAGEVFALDVVEETPQEQEEQVEQVEEGEEELNPNKARLDLPLRDDKTPLSLPVIPEGAADLSDDQGTYGYIVAL